jgi:hypothetical protein
MTTTAGFSKPRLERIHDVTSGHVEAGGPPGLVTGISRRDLWTAGYQALDD